MGAVSRLVSTWLLHRPIAHRGLHNGRNERPENSCSAFDAACQQGFPIELDVQLLADGSVAVVHDRDLSRVTGQKCDVRSLDADQLSKLRLLDTDQRIPVLEEVLALVAERVPILIEIKNREAPGPLENRVVELLEAYSGPVAIQSFNPRSLSHLRHVAPQYIRGQLAGRHVNRHLNGVERLLLQNLAANVISRPHFIGYELAAFPSVPVALQRWLQVPVLAWTVRSYDEQQRAERYADNFIFENFLPIKERLRIR